MDGLKIVLPEKPNSKDRIYIPSDERIIITDPIIDNGNIEKNTISYYEYVFGIDSLVIGETNINKNTCFISNEIEIGYLNKNEYIQMEANYFVDKNSSVEFYIIDGSSIKPILPMNDTKVYNEKIFHGLKTRFAINSNEPYEIKKDNNNVNITLEEAVKDQKNLYTINYTPINSHSITNIKNSSIKIKIVLRLFDENSAAPYVTRVTIKKFGGNSLWKESK